MNLDVGASTWVPSGPAPLYIYIYSTIQFPNTVWWSGAIDPRRPNLRSAHQDLNFLQLSLFCHFPPVKHRLYHALTSNTIETTSRGHSIRHGRLSVRCVTVSFSIIQNISQLSLETTSTYVFFQNFKTYQTFEQHFQNLETIGPALCVWHSGQVVCFPRFFGNS
jgi:hypothetical protein